MTRTRHLPAWIAAVALVFAAVSPALAAALFADRPQISARILGLAVATATHDVPDCHDEGAAAEHAGHEGRDQHASHGVFCSFCLVASSLLALPSCAPEHVAPASAFVEADNHPASFVTFGSIGYRARGPPLSP